MPFDWPTILTRNRADLARLVMVLFGLAGVFGERMPQETRCAVLRMLRPLEAAMRRLIVIAARGLVMAQALRRAMPEGGILRGDGAGPGAFSLFDRRRRFGLSADRPGDGWGRGGPQIRLLDEAIIGPGRRLIAAARDVDAAPIMRRLARLRRALGRLPQEARRLVRWRMRHAKVLKGPMRPGRPPGFRARAGDDPAQELLRELQLLALFAVNAEKA